MRVIIKNKELEDYNKEFKVRRINYDKVLVIYPNVENLKEFYNIDVEIIPENNLDTFLMQNKELLKIKLKRGISVFLYKALLEEIRINCNEEIKDINLLIDNYSVNKNNIWEKNLLLVVNKTYPLKILASGRKFNRKNYNLETEVLYREEFINICTKEIYKIKKDIEKKEKLLSKYDEAIKNLDKSKGKGRFITE